MQRGSCREMNLPEGWLNDGAKAFVSTRHGDR